MASESGEKAKEELISIRSTALSLPRKAVKDLLSVGACARCIFRLFGIRGSSSSSSNYYSSSLLSNSLLRSLLKESNGVFEDIESSSQESLGEEAAFCSICLGVLQFAYCTREQEKYDSNNLVSDFALSIAELVKQEGHQINGFSLEISLPPIVMANERAIRLYMKKKYGSEGWFLEKFLKEHILVKDALKLSITSSLETLLGVKSGVSSFRIRLTYSHVKASSKLQSLVPKDHSCKRRKTGTDESVHNGVDSHVQTRSEYTEEVISDSDAVIRRALDSLQDHEFCEHFILPPEKVYEPCCLAFHCYRMPIYLGGRYLKYSRNVSQTRWIIDDERMGEASVEEIIGSNVLPICKGDNFKFHAAGREDIDVRMLGPGRPFLIEIQNARHIPTPADREEIELKISNSNHQFVKVRNLNLVDSQAWTLMREGEAEKQKQYAALVWISRPLDDDDHQTISSLKDMDVFQRTPIRVLHRRSPLERKRIIHWMKIERIVGSCQYFLLHLCTQAGTYIKEFVHGDLGRTHPSIGSILGCRAEILQLDVTDVKMDYFN